MRIILHPCRIKQTVSIQYTDGFPFAWYFYLDLHGFHFHLLFCNNFQLVESGNYDKYGK